VEQERMANAQLFDVWVEAFGTELLFFVVFLKKCEYPMVLSDLEIPPDLKIIVIRSSTKFRNILVSASF
jgi:hypothetical protein